jgi:hypothetical protein
MTLSFAMPLSYFSTSIEATHDTGGFTELAMKQRLCAFMDLEPSQRKHSAGSLHPAIDL